MENRDYVININGGSFNSSQVGDNRNAKMVVNNQTDGKKEKIEELVTGILKRHNEYLYEVSESQELSEEEKDEAMLALTKIKMLLDNKELDPDKLKKPVSILEKTSYVAAICSAVTDLYQLLS